MNTLALASTDTVRALIGSSEPEEVAHCNTPEALYLATKTPKSYAVVSVTLGGPKNTGLPVKSPHTYAFPETSQVMEYATFAVPAPMTLNHCSAPELLNFAT